MRERMRTVPLVVASILFWQSTADECLTLIDDNVSAGRSLLTPLRLVLHSARVVLRTRRRARITFMSVKQEQQIIRSAVLQL